MFIKTVFKNIYLNINILFVVNKYLYYIMFKYTTFNLQLNVTDYT